MGFFGGVMGGIGGLLTGGPVGAAAGFVGGLVGGGGTTNTSNVSTQQTHLRKLNSTEQGLRDQSAAGASASMEQMTPEARQQMLDENYKRLYGASSERINTAYDDAGARDYANAASRGAGNTSAGRDRADRQTAYRSRELGLASDQANLGSQEMLLRQRADRRANAAAYMENLRAVWNRQLQGSKVVTTSQGTATAPDTTIQDSMGLIGHGLTSSDSWYNNRGGDSGNYLWDDGKQGPVP